MKSVLFVLTLSVLVGGAAHASNKGPQLGAKKGGTGVRFKKGVVWNTTGPQGTVHNAPAQTIRDGAPAGRRGGQRGDSLYALPGLEHYVRGM